MANSMTFDQLSTVLNSIVSQATGKTAITPTDTSSFIAVANTALQTGYDPVIAAVSQVLSRTIFSIRPYTAKFRGIRVDDVRYGNHVRKLQTVDKPFENDARLPLTDGQSVDQWTVNKPVVLQTNFYGQAVYQKSLTIFKDQLDSAFSGPDQFGEFVSMVTQNAYDLIEQATESTARMTVANFIGGKIVGDAPNVIHLVTEYNNIKGTTLTTDTVRAPQNFGDFARWMFSRISNLASYMSERTSKYHINVTDKTIMRHTPADRLKIYLYKPLFAEVDANVLSNTFNDGYLRLADNEMVNFWQAIDSPDGINITPSYMGPTGVVLTPEEAVVQSDIVGVMFDEEAIGVNRTNEWSQTTPLNAKGGYSNMFWHFTNRYWNDFTENGVVLVLD